MKMRMKIESEGQAFDDDIESINSDEFNMLLGKWLGFFFLIGRFCLKSWINFFRSFWTRWTKGGI